MNKKRIALTLLMAFLSEIANKVVPLVNLHLVAAQLGVEAFGVAQYAIWLLEWGIVFIVFGFPQVAPVMLCDAKTPDEERLVNGSVVLSRLLLALISSIALLAIVFSQESLAAYKPAVVSSLFIMAASALDSSWILAAKQKLALMSLISITAKILSVVAIFLLIKSPEDSTAFVIITNTVNASIAVASFLVAARLVGLSWPRMRRTKEALVSASPFAFAFFLFLVVDRFDLYLVENYFGSTATGLYSAASKLIASVIPIIVAISAVFYSEMLAHSNTNTLENLIKSSLFWVLSVVAPLTIFMILFSKELLTVVFGEPYAEASTLLSILSIGAIFFSAIWVFGFQLLAMKKKWLPLVVALFTGTITGLAAGHSFALSGMLGGIAIAAVGAKVVSAITITKTAISAWNISLNSLLIGVFRPLLPSILSAALFLCVFRSNFLTGSALVQMIFFSITHMIIFCGINLKELKNLAAQIYRKVFVLE